VADMRDARLMVELARYSATKDKTSFDSANLGAVGGWPLKVDNEGNILCYSLPPLPLMHRVDIGDSSVAVSLEQFMGILGGADGALPELSRACMAMFRRGSVPLDSRPDIEHCISDKRVADPVTRLNHYYG
jgi:hypothetical protein